MTSGQKSFPCVAPMFKFAQHGQSGRLGQRAAAAHRRRSPTTSRSSSRCNTEAINHDPAITFIQTGHQQPGRPSLGAWLSYGLGSENQNLPAFVVMISQGSGNKTDQPIFSRLWGSGFLPTPAPGRPVPLGRRPGALPLEPAGHRRRRRAARMLDGVGRAQPAWPAESFGDPEINTRIAQYEMAFRMQTSRPRADRPLAASRSTSSTLYGIDDTGADGGFARNCLLARRMVERGVRFVQLMHRGWDQHSNLPDADPRPVPGRRPARPPPWSRT